MIRSLSALLVFGTIALAQDKPVDFQREIRPLLSDNCFQCHGPDKDTRMMDLRLDTKEGAFEQRKTGTPIVPGKPEQSLVYQRITAEKPARRMPPASTHKTLTPKQIETMGRWIQQGATWKEHWAFSTPVRPQPPAVRAKTWVRNPIDQFILAKLEAAGLQPAPEADRRTMIRRLSLDLTGLPPAPADVQAFLNDKSPKAYEKLVDRLLASPRYGEHRGRYWLDAARYGDTHGIHVDNYVELWPYRDWVIQAFNRNLPFDRFTIEQLAGDLLPNPTLQQQIASGFQRCNITTSEGGSILDEVAAMYAKDRADTTGTVWMGLTVGCATCHDHKFDPISQKEFYSLTAFFRNTTQYPMDGNIPDTPPSLIVPRAEDQKRWEELNEQRANLRRTLAEAKESRRTAFESWLDSPERRAIQDPFPVASRVLDLNVGSAAELSQKGQPQPLALTEGMTIGDGAPDAGKALHFGKDSFLALPNVPEIDGDRPFTIATWVYLPKKEGYVIASQFGPDPEQKDSRDRRTGWIVEIGDGGPSIRLAAPNRSYISARPGPDFKLKPESWYHLVYTYDGSRDRAGLAIYVNGKFVPTVGSGEDIEEFVGSARTDVSAPAGSRRDEAIFEDGAIAEFRIPEPHGG